MTAIGGLAVDNSWKERVTAFDTVWHTYKKLSNTELVLYL